MSKLLNLSSCRCCHTGGVFKSLFSVFVFENDVENYSTMLRDTLGVHIETPKNDSMCTICDKCIVELCNAAHFKKQVLACEEKFEKYVKVQQFLKTDVGQLKIEEPWDKEYIGEIYAENIKAEVEDETISIEEEQNSDDFCTDDNDSKTSEDWKCQVIDITHGMSCTNPALEDGDSSSDVDWLKPVYESDGESNSELS